MSRSRLAGQGSAGRGHPGRSVAVGRPRHPRDRRPLRADHSLARRAADPRRPLVRRALRPGLVDRGFGAAGIAIDSAPPKGVFAFEPTTLLSLGRILLIPFGWRKVVRWSYPEYRYAFVHTMPPDEQRAIWDAQIVPDSGRPFFQSGFAMFDRASPARVDFANPARAPLLFISGADQAMPLAIVRRMYRAHQASPARTDFRSFPGRTHWLIAQDGWQEVAQACIDWIGSLAPRVESGIDKAGDLAGKEGSMQPKEQVLAASASRVAE